MFDSNVYVNRRKKLKNILKKGIVLILGNKESPMNYPDNTYHFRQSSSFLYFFGLDMPNIAGVIDIDNDSDILFADDVSIDDIIWMGPQENMSIKASKVGISKLIEQDKLIGFVTAEKGKGRTIHYLPQYRFDNMIKLEEMLNIPAGKVNEHASMSLIKAVVALREIKSSEEIIELEEAARIGYEMHVTAMKMGKPGIKEQKIAGTIEGIAKAYGTGISFPVILSQNGQTLHNHDHSQILQLGRMMLVDAGAESNSHYASDYTRTVPVGGKFNSRQKDVYSIVLAANNHAASLIKPGVTYQSIHLEAAKTIILGLKDLGLLNGNPLDFLMEGIHALFMPHGLGHQMGLDVHDMEDLGEDNVGYDEITQRINVFGIRGLRMGKTLKPGHVITNEPGLYFIPELFAKWKNEKKFSGIINYDKVAEYLDFGGVRLEDDILLTETGSTYIGKRLPITIEEVENTMKD